MATIINEYKREFVWKRFLQTVFGGPKLKLGYHAPTYVYINQALLFVLPFLIGGIFTLLVEFDVVANHVACYVYGSIMILFVLIGQILSHFIQKNSNDVTRLDHNLHVLSEEDEIEFYSCLGSDTFSFVLPVKKININILIHALLAGPLCGVGLWYLLPSTLDSLFNHVGATVVLYIFGWFTICVAQYSLTVTSPPEPVTFRSTDPYELRPLMRPFYVYIFLAFHVVHWYDTDFELVNEVLHVVFIFLPLLWTLALLPPMDALLLWLMEQCLIILGGSPMAGDLRLIVMLLASCSSFVVIYFFPSSEAITITAACFGYFLSLDHASLMNQIITKVMKRDSTKKSANQDPPKVHIGFGWQWRAKELIFHLFMLAFIGGIAVGVSLSANDFSPTVSKAVGYAVLGLAVLVIILGEMQGVYMVFGMWRNYLYPHSIMEMGKYSKAKSLLIKVAVLRRIIIDFVAPILMLLYLCLGFAPDPVTLPSFKFTLGVIRGLRWVWQGTFNSMVEISVVHVINQAMTPSGWWFELGLSTQLLFTGLLWNRLHQLINKLTCYFTILVTSYTYDKQRLKHSALIIILSAIFFPIILLLILFATFLSTPLLPVFTLPIMLIAFPRPMRSWPGVVGGSANTCQDTIYYKQLSPKLATALKNCCTSGSLGNLSAGAHFLARFQDRMTWLQVLECGYGYWCFSIKGMELQETSCHTEEAAKIDDLFESSFNSEDGFPFFTFNRDPFHVLTPVDAIPVDTYSSAKTVLTGVIDSPDTLRSIGKNFWKSLTWVLLQHITHREKIPSSKTMSPTNLNHFEANRIDRGSVNSRAALVEFKGNNSKLDIKGENDEKDSGRATGETPRPVTAASRKSRKSLASSWGSLNSWNDDESMDQVPFSKLGNKIPLSNLSREKTESRNIPGMVDVEENDDDLESILKDLAIGLPPVDIGDINERKTAKNLSDPLTQTGSIKLAGSIQFSSPHSSKLSLPLKWRDIPLDSHQISPLLSDFPKDWYRHVLQHLDLSSGMPSSDVVDEIISDEALTSIYTQLVSAIFSVVNVLGLSGVDFVTRGPMHVSKVFNGDIPWSMSLDWLTQDDELFNLVIKAYRFAVKLSFDEVLYGETSDNDEVREYFDEYQADWYMGVETDAKWNESVLQEKPHLFSIGCDTSHHPPVFTSHILSRQPVMVSIGRLNAEIIRSLWASLSMELFYFTNDDEERYSIQAHPTILRNLTVQSADPPLGYPIFYSKPISIPTF